jgi:hypothetical protein
MAFSPVTLAFGQGRDSLAAKPVAEARFALRLRPDATIRFVSGGGRRKRATVIRVDANDLVIRAGDGTQRVQLSAIDSLWVRGRAWKRGAVGGAIFGEVLWLTAATFVGSCPFECVQGKTDPVVTWSPAIFGAAFSGIGLAIGGASHVWHRRHP